jgi:hypothetical protein
MTRTPDRKSPRERRSGTADHPQWDRKQGRPKDGQTARDVERSSDRYSASEQSEEKSPSSTKE